MERVKYRPTWSSDGKLVCFVNNNICNACQQNGLAFCCTGKCSGLFAIRLTPKSYAWLRFVQGKSVQFCFVVTNRNSELPCASGFERRAIQIRCMQDAQQGFGYNPSLPVFSFLWLSVFYFHSLVFQSSSVILLFTLLLFLSVPLLLHISFFTVIVSFSFSLSLSFDCFPFSLLDSF